jgi:hypothetical protein
MIDGWARRVSTDGLQRGRGVEECGKSGEVTPLHIGHLNFLGWVDHDNEHEQSILRALGATKGHDARDELGLGTIRDRFADLIFPGSQHRSGADSLFSIRAVVL